MVMARVSAIACGYEDANDLDRLRHDPLMKLAVGRCPESGGALASQSTICRLENAPRKTEAARLCAALIDQFGTTVRPGKIEILDIDDTFCAAHGGQQLAFWNAHHDERGFAPMHIYHVASGTPVVAILRPARTAKGTEVRCVIKHVTKRLRKHWPNTRIVWRGDGHSRLDHQRGNITGVTSMTTSMGSKRLGLLRDLLPRATRVAVLVDPNDDATVVKSMIADVRGAARSIGREIEVFYRCAARL
jgi:hypothetical protein